MGQIYLVRHGQASFGKADYDQLSALGEQQGRILGDWFAQRNQTFHRVVTGAMKRHHQTASACLGQMPQAAAEWDVDAGFNEYDHHEVLARHRPDFADQANIRQFLRDTPQPQRAFQLEFQAAMRRWMAGAHDAEYGETWAQFQARCIGALQRLLDTAQASQDILVFTSGGTIATLCQHVLGIPDRQVMELNWTLVNAAVTKLFYQPDRVVLSYLNNFSHLESAQLDNVVTYR